VNSVSHQAEMPVDGEGCFVASIDHQCQVLLQSLADWYTQTTGQDSFLHVLLSAEFSTTRFIGAHGRMTVKEATQEKDVIIAGLLASLTDEFAMNSYAGIIGTGLVLCPRGMDRQGVGVIRIPVRVEGANRRQENLTHRSDATL